MSKMKWLGCSVLMMVWPAWASPTPTQARIKLGAAFECRDARDDTYDIPALLKTAGSKRTQHEVDEAGNYSSTYMLEKPIILFGQPVSKLLTWQNVGDGGDASFGLNAYYRAPMSIMTKAARISLQNFDGKKLHIRKISKQTSLIMDTREARTVSFCETTITADDFDQ